MFVMFILSLLFLVLPPPPYKSCNMVLWTLNTTHEVISKAGCCWCYPGSAGHCVLKIKTIIFFRLKMPIKMSLRMWYGTSLQFTCISCHYNIIGIWVQYEFLVVAWPTIASIINHIHEFLIVVPWGEVHEQVRDEDCEKVVLPNSCFICFRRDWQSSTSVDLNSQVCSLCFDT